VSTTVNERVPLSVASDPGRRALRDWRLPARIPPNLFGVAFGLAGLADAWWAAEKALGTPRVAADAVSVVAAIVWLGLLVAYVRQGPRQLAHDLGDRTAAPFVSIAPITGMLLSTALASYFFEAGQALVVVFLAATLAVGAWLTGQWIVADLEQDSVHPGYFLPTVAGGLIGAFAASQVQLQSIAEMSFGIGIICWFLLGSILLNRLFFRPGLPAALVPTLAIEAAPPAVAGVAYYAISGGAADPVAYVLAGYALLMTLVQLRFLRIYARLRFGPGFWAFTFSYSAVATDALLWIARDRGAGATAIAVVVLACITIFILSIAARTVVAIVHHQFLPPSQVATGASTQRGSP
jgi:tellurite resistance protein